MDLEIIAARSPVKPPTLADVARLAGVSTTTASRVLNGGVRGKKSGSAEVRKRVTDAARSLGYSVNPAAQTTKEGRARTVALLVDRKSTRQNSSHVAISYAVFCLKKK